MSLARTEDFAPPSRGDAALFELKASLFRLRRLFQNGLAGPERLEKGDPAAFSHVIAQSRTPLWAEVPAAERTLQRGKVQNLRVAARQLDCTAMTSSAVFSFWKQLGRASANTIEILDGLKEGDKVILSDMAYVQSAERIHLTDEKHVASH